MAIKLAIFATMDQVEEYILESNDAQRRLFQLARGLIKVASPQMREHFSYKVPFYSHYGKVCYLNRFKAGIDIGFLRGYELSDPRGVLVGEGRTQVKSLRYNSIEDFNEEVLVATLQEAIIIDEMYHKGQKNERSGR